RIASIEDSLTEIQPQLFDERAELEALQDELIELNESHENESNLLTEKSQAFNSENILYHQHVNRVTSLEQEIEFKQTAYEGSKERIGKSQSELSQLDTEVRSLLDNNEV